MCLPCRQAPVSGGSVIGPESVQVLAGNGVRGSSTEGAKEMKVGGGSGLVTGQAGDSRQAQRAACGCRKHGGGDRQAERAVR